MYCNKCGKKLNDSDLFCSKCGNKIERIKQEPEIKLNEEQEYSNSQNEGNLNQNQKVKLVFTKGVEGYFAVIGIYIDDIKIGRIKYKKVIETYVTVGEHRLDLKDYNLVSRNYVLNITPDIKTVYIHLYNVSTHPKIKYIKTEKLNGEQQQSNNEIIKNKSVPHSHFKPDYVEIDEEGVVKEIKKSIIWAPLSFLIGLMGFCLEQIPLAIAAIILGIIGFTEGSRNKAAIGTSITGIVIGIATIVYILCVVKSQFII